MNNNLFFFTENNNVKTLSIKKLANIDNPFETFPIIIENKLNKNRIGKNKIKNKNYYENTNSVEYEKGIEVKRIEMDKNIIHFLDEEKLIEPDSININCINEISDSIARA